MQSGKTKYKKLHDQTGITFLILLACNITKNTTIFRTQYKSFVTTFMNVTILDIIYLQEEELY